MSDYYDELDTQDARIRERAMFAHLPTHLSDAISACSGLAEHLAGQDVSTMISRKALQRLPVLRKTALMAAQKAQPPFGGFVNPAAMAGCRIFKSPGPVWEPQVSGRDPWQSARALHAAGFGPEERVHNTFSYHQTPGGLMLDEGARALGCSVFPAGTISTEQQVQAMQEYAATAFVGTPDYLLTVLNYAQTNGIALPSLKRAMVSGGALFPAMREQFKVMGIHVQQCYATADLGVIAYESSSDGVIHPGMLVNENLIVEIVRPGTGDVVADGEVGEVVVTRLNNDYPLVRFATGDLSMFIDELSPCGRTQRRIAGWMGRADQRTKVRGMFVDPEQIQAVRQVHQSIGGLRLLVDRENGKDVMLLRYLQEDNNQAETELTPDTIAATLKRITGLTGRVEQVSESLPNDGVVIEDKRKYD